MVLSGFSSISDQELRDLLPAVMRKDKLLDLDFLIKKKLFRVALSFISYKYFCFYVLDNSFEKLQKKCYRR